MRRTSPYVTRVVGIGLRNWDSLLDKRGEVSGGPLTGHEGSKVIRVCVTLSLIL